MNVLLKSVYFKLLERPRLHSTKVKFFGYNDTPIPVIGRCVTDIKHRPRNLFQLCSLWQILSHVLLLA